MANEIQGRGPGAGKSPYFLVRNHTSGFVWNGTSFVAYASGQTDLYDVALTEQGLSNYYVGNFPSAIPAGVYAVEARDRIGAAPAETDPIFGMETFQWNGAVAAPLSDTATSGQLGQTGPIRIARGTMIQNFPIYFKSSVDHITPFTSGVVSGQIARDGGSFGALQSGAFTEIGQGFYNLQALTSGDLLANSVKLLFTAVGISGGNADPVPLSLVLQRTSGQ